MEISIFKQITTEEALIELECEAEKYNGLWCDMNNKEERKYVKDKAQFISSLLKALDRARIDTAKDYKLKVESEAPLIKLRLEAANLPFQTLIDEHKAERAKILAAEKAVVDAEIAAKQLVDDHEQAIMMDELETLRIEKAKSDAADEAQKLKDAAAEREKQAAWDAKVKAEQEAAAEVERAKQAEEQALLDKVNAEKAAKDAAAQAERNAESAKAAAEQAAIAAEAKRIADIEQAKQGEIARQQAEQQRIVSEEAERLADREHISRTRRECKESIMALGIAESAAKTLVIAMTKGHVKHVRMLY